MICSLDAELLMNYGLKIGELKPDAEKKLMAMQTHTSRSNNTKKRFHNTDPKDLVSPEEFKKMSGKKYRQYLSSHIRTQPNKGLNPSSLEAVLVNTNLNMIRGRLDSDTYLLFKDGTAYGDCKIPIQDLNVKMSKILEGPAYSKYPKWTRWKKKGGKYYIQNLKTKQWKLLKKAQKALPGKKGERLNNTFWTFSGSQFFGSHQGYYKLMPNGRFEIYNFTMRQNDLRAQDMDGTIPYLGTVSESDKTGSTANSVAIGNNFGGGASHKRKDGNKNTGTYYIDGYTIELHHDNGWVHRELFHFPSKDKKKSIQIKDTIYWVREYD
ncbi:MAG: hypothetical protein CSB47_01040 [Proteobacteria bacterium]|nr:MAG: hypothetical protein CSB47_01040 [Pseudomonadota bacterium]